MYVWVLVLVLVALVILLLCNDFERVDRTGVKCNKSTMEKRKKRKKGNRGP